MLTITSKIKLSVTSNSVTPVVCAKQYDNMGRKILCSVYQGRTPLTLDSDTIINVSGRNADGEIFQYSSDSNSDIVSIDNGKIIIWVTSVMSAAPGRTFVDVTITDGNGKSLGMFPFVLHVQRMTLENIALSTGSYASLISLLANNIVNCYINDDGYLVIVSEDGLGLTFEMDEEGSIMIYCDGESAI